MRDKEEGRLLKSWLALALVVTLGVVIGLAASPVAADDKFIRVDDLKGEVIYDDYRGWSHLNAYRHIINKPGKEPACKVIVDKPIDSVSPALWMAAITGKILEEVEVSYTKSIASEHLPYFISFMKMVSIKKLISLEDADEEVDILQDRIILLPESIKLTYILYDPTGAQDGSIVEELNCTN